MRFRTVLDTSRTLRELASQNGMSRSAVIVAAGCCIIEVPPTILII